MRFKESSSTTNLLSCSQNGLCMTDPARIGSSYTYNSWNLTFNINDVILNDTNIYYAEADLIDTADENLISTITSAVTITVTSTEGT